MSRKATKDGFEGRKSFWRPPQTLAQSLFGTSQTQAQTLFGTSQTQTKPLFGTPETQAQPLFGTPSTGFSLPSASTVTPQEPESEKEITTSVFDNPSSTTDITLEVEGRLLHVNRGILAEASLVFEEMFQGDFKEKNAIPLPNKSYAEIVEMLLRIYPSELKSITRSQVDKLLQLADEYKMMALTKKCERFLLYQCTMMTSNDSISPEELAHYIYLADKYHLDKLLSRATDMAAPFVFGGNNHGTTWATPGILNHEEYPLIREPTQLLLALKRIAFLEGKNT